MPNVYYNPEKFDLVPVGEIEMYEPNYSFDTIVVWRHTPTGDLYWARDAVVLERSRARTTRVACDTH